MTPAQRSSARKRVIARSEVREKNSSQWSWSGATYPAGFEEDEGMRSDFVRQLTLQQISQKSAQSTVDSADQEQLIPRTLLQYWHDLNDMPDDVRTCLDSWAALRDDGVAMLLFDDNSAHSYIAKRYGRRETLAFERCRHPAMRSDYLRLCFVLAEGGLYVDADDVRLGDSWKKLFSGEVLKLQPLCYDVKIQGMVSARELRRPDLPTEGRIFYLNNNPIASPPDHPVLRRALSRSTEILLGNDATPEIQSTTGPGNLTASLAAHALELQNDNAQPDFEFLLDWDSTAETRWELGYREDARNWRNMGRG
jgi:hypothetical protein